MKLLQKGARVHVTGRLVEEAWQDKDGEARTAIRLNLDDIYLSTMRIDTVTFKARSEGARVVEQEGVPA